jgi:two-component system LytT family response regulator
MKCIVVDDEPFALNLIKSYVEKTPFLELSGSFTNPFKALGHLREHKTDLVFLDINMPELSGIQLLQSLNTPPKVIFTTAYPEFGAESYEYNAIDYLLKPVKYERFLKAVNKAVELSSDNDSLKEEKIKDFDINESSDFIYLKSGTQIHKIKIDSIMYIEAAGNYMTFYTNTKKLMTLLSMKEVLELLPSNTFTRIHKSFIVSMNYIDIIEKHRLIINNQPIPIGVTYRQKFHQNFDKN